MNAFTTTLRKHLTDQQKAKLFLDRGGRCHRCKRKLGAPDKWTVEHIQALQNGGRNSWDNLGVCCSWCFPEKNREDHAKAAKSRHVATAHVVPTMHRSKKGRPLPGSRRSGWRKRFDGSVERR